MIREAIDDGSTDSEAEETRQKMRKLKAAKKARMQEAAAQAKGGGS